MPIIHGYLSTGSHSAKVTFRIIEMNIEKWRHCDDYLEENLEMIKTVYRETFQHLLLRKVCMNLFIMLLKHDLCT